MRKLATKCRTEEREPDVDPPEGAIIVRRGPRGSVRLYVPGDRWRDVEDLWTAHRLAERLSAKLGRPLFIVCEFPAEFVRQKPKFNRKKPTRKVG